MSSSLREEVAPYPPPRSIVISHFSDKIFQNFVRPSSIRPPKMRSFFAFLSVFLLSFCLRVFAVWSLVASFDRLGTAGFSPGGNQMVASTNFTQTW